MKIYNEVITRFNDVTGQWETLSEDSYDYSGPVAYTQGGIPPNATSIITASSFPIQQEARKSSISHLVCADCAAI